MFGRLVAWMAVVVLFGGCKEEPKGTVTSRFEAVKAATAQQAGSSGGGFCEKVFPASGEGARKYARPVLRELPAGSEAAVVETAAAGGWTWVNLWATWCEPCRDEMALLGRWKDSLAREGSPFRLELLSADAPADGAALKTAIERGLPGPVSWIRSEEDLGPYLESLGVGRDAALPIHALVDPRGSLRCVRVGAIHDRDYPVVKGLLSER